MRWFINEVEELYLIGWKGNEDVFNRLLKTQTRNLRKIIIVNPMEKKKKEVTKNLKKHLDLARYKIEVVNTFEDFVLKKMDSYLIN
jgi:hypothetical protein